MASLGLNTVKAMRSVNGAVRNYSQTSRSSVTEDSNKKKRNTIETGEYAYPYYGNSYYRQGYGQGYGVGGYGKQKYGQGYGGGYYRYDPYYYGGGYHGHY